MRFLHVMLRVRNLERAVEFYTRALGMRLLRKKDYPEGRFTLAFLGYGEESEITALELTHNWDTDDYENGTAYGHMAIGVDDLERAYQHALENGGTSKVAPKTFGSGTRLAFVKDPDGYDVEFIETKTRRD
ncbi:MAG: lactoylglutathione lyase [Armatimonadetes bacterium]|nr:lactoylglutathione lyase [Armatimonadota bacterium]